MAQNNFKYDFTSLSDRRNAGSGKWEQMREWNQNVDNDVIPLSVADMEIPTCIKIKEGLKEFIDQQVLGYAMPYDKFYEAIINWQKRRHNFNIKKEWVINTAGIVTAVYAGILAFSNESDGVMVFKPVYYPFSDSIKLAERTEVNIPLINKNMKYSIDFEKFESEAKKEKNKILILCSPHNPTGNVWSKEDLIKIAKIAKENNVLVISDEIWNDIIMPGSKHHVFATVSDDAKNNSVICTAPSKTFNLAGLKSSNIIIPNKDLRIKFADTLANMRQSSLNILAYKACEIAYNTSEDWLEELLLLIEENQAIVKEHFTKNHPEIKVYNAQGTFLTWIDFSSIGMGHKELEEFLHTKAQFFTDEGYVFGDEGIGFERLNIGCPSETLKIQLNKLTKALNSL